LAEFGDEPRAGEGRFIVFFPVAVGQEADDGDASVLDGMERQKAVIDGSERRPANDQNGKTNVNDHVEDQIVLSYRDFDTTDTLHHEE
jgi:hypothetical protein